MNVAANAIIRLLAVSGAILLCGCVGQRPLERPDSWPSPTQGKCDVDGTFRNSAVDSARNRYSATEGISLAHKMLLYLWPTGTTSQPSIPMAPETVRVSVATATATVEVTSSMGETISFKNGSDTKITCQNGSVYIATHSQYVSGGATEYLSYEMELYLATSGDLIVRTLRTGDRVAASGGIGPLPRKEAWFRFASVK